MKNAPWWTMWVVAGMLGCTLPAGAQDPGTPADARQPAAAKDEAREDAKPGRALVLPEIALSREMLYAFLVGEVAAQRGQVDVAAQAYYELLMATKDPRIAERAFQMAYVGRQYSRALDVARVWAAAAPGELRPKQVSVILPLSLGRLEEARRNLGPLLATPEEAPRTFLGIPHWLGAHASKPATLVWIKDLAAGYPDLPEARVAVSLVAVQANDDALAQSEARQALRLRPGWEVGVRLLSGLLEESKPGEAADILNEYLGSHPEAHELRYKQARLLVAARRYPEAETLFGQILAANPEDVEARIDAGVLATHLKKYPEAEAHLLKALDLRPRGNDVTWYYMGLLHDVQNQTDKALAAFGKVRSGKYLASSQGRYARILFKQGRPEAALAHIKQLAGKPGVSEIDVIQLEAEVLREAKAYRKAFEVLTGGLKKFPDNADLLYDRAMAAERLGLLNQAETDLRKILQVKPDNALVLNALGYTLADRTTRYTEAYDLLSRAIKLSPEDPYILDSMGWVLFKLGRHEEALTYLKRSYQSEPHAETAAHIGEVLWVLGRRDEAQQMWRSGLERFPGDEALLAVTARLQP